MSSKILGFVESPFQLTQFVEFVHSQKLYPKRVRLIIRLNKTLANTKQINSIIKLFKQENWRVQFVYNARFFAMLGIIWSLRYRGHSILIGDENNYFSKTVTRYINSKCFIFLDDGVSTLNSKRDFRRFSIFSNKDEGKNNFSFISSFIHQQTRHLQASDEVSVVVGGGLVDPGVCTFDHYKGYIYSICRELNKKSARRIIYIPHRNEGKYMEVLKKDVLDAYGVSYVSLELPIEFVQKELQVKVVEFVGFFSTALYSLPIVYPHAAIGYFRMPSQDIRARKENIENIYAALRSCSSCHEVSSG